VASFAIMRMLNAERVANHFQYKEDVRLIFNLISFNVLGGQMWDCFVCNLVLAKDFSSYFNQKCC